MLAKSRTPMYAARTATQARAIQRLDPQIKVRTTPITNYGSVAQAEGQSAATGLPESLNLVLDNSAGVVAKDYKIGDPNNWVLPAVGLAGVDPDRSSGISGAAFADIVTKSPMTIKAIGYRATSGAVQFSEPFFYVIADVDGSGLKKPVNMAQYQRNTADDPNLLTLEFQNEFVLGDKRAFYVSAGIGQVVTLTLMFGAGRYQ